MLRLLLLALAFPLLGAAQRIFPPLRIVGNVYYVGDNDLASYLITTPKGSILINTGYEYSVPRSGRASRRWASSSPTSRFCW
jgi:metallo-beta-lactamase class B